MPLWRRPGLLTWRCRALIPMQVSAFEIFFRGHPTLDVRPSSSSVVANGKDHHLDFLWSKARQLLPKAILMSQQEKSNSADLQRSRVILTGVIRF